MIVPIARFSEVYVPFAKARCSKFVENSTLLVRELPQELSSVRPVSLFDRGKTVLALPVPSSVKTKVCLKWKEPRATVSAVDRKYKRFKVLFEAI